MSQKIHIITYGDKNFQNSKIRLYKECIQTNWFDTVQTFGPEDLTGDFKKEFNKILLKPRGAGYWIWKYDIIKQQLTKLPNNDILIYIDSGCSVNIKGRSRLDEYINMLNKSNESIISFQMPHLERKFTIKEIFHSFNMNVNDNNGNSGQYLATVLIMKNDKKMMEILEDCINTIRKDQLIVTDYYNKLEQCNEFIDNRHDQSILSLARKKHGSIILGDETWFQPFGNKESLKYPFWATRKRY